MAKVVEKRSDGTTVVEVPPADATKLKVGEAVDVLPKLPGPAQDEPWPFGALAGKYPSVEIEDIKAARRETLLGKAE